MIILAKDFFPLIFFGNICIFFLVKHNQIVKWDCIVRHETQSRQNYSREPYSDVNLNRIFWQWRIFANDTRTFDMNFACSWHHLQLGQSELRMRGWSPCDWSKAGGKGYWRPPHTQ